MNSHHIIPAYTCIAGDNQLPWSDFYTAIIIIDKARGVEEKLNNMGVYYPDNQIMFAYRDLSLALGFGDITNPSEFTYLLERYQDELLPPCCSFEWVNSEYIVLPFVDLELVEDELPESTTGFMDPVIIIEGNEATLYSPCGVTWVREWVMDI